MNRLILHCLPAALFLLAVPLQGQSLFLDPIGTGPAVTVTGGGGPPTSSVELFKNGISAGSFSLPSGGSFQTYVFDLGTDAGGNPTAWLDPSAPVGMNIYIPGVGTNHVLEIDSIRLTESLNWEFNESGDFAEWDAAANTTRSNTGNGVLRLTSIGNDWVAATRPFRPIGSTHFVQMETRLRKVSVNSPNSLIQWNYISNPAAYNGGAIQFFGPASAAISITR